MPPATRILDALAAEGVDTSWVRRDPQRPTGLMLKDAGAGVRYYRTGSAASVMGPEILDGVPAAEARAVLVTGVTALLGEAPHAAGLALLEAARGLRIVDPNLRNGLWGSDRRAELVLPFIERCDLLLAGAEELEEILTGAAGRVGVQLGCGIGGGRWARSEALARRATAHGPREVVVRGHHDDRRARRRIVDRARHPARRRPSIRSAPEMPSTPATSRRGCAAGPSTRRCVPVRNAAPRSRRRPVTRRAFLERLE